MSNKLDAASGIHETLPTIFGYIGICIALGIISRAAGINLFLTIFMSAFMYAGSAQFVAVAMIAVKSPILSIVLAVFLINARMILMGMTVAPFLQNETIGKNIIIGTLLTDESFALSMNKLNYTKRKLNFQWFNAVNILAYSVWVLATALGAWAGNFITNPQKLGLNFAVIAMFIGLLYLQISSDRTLKITLQFLMVIITLVLTYIIYIFIPSNLAILIITLSGCAVGMVIKHVFF